MDAVAEVGVEPPGWTEHHPAASGDAAIGVRRGVRPWSVGHPAVRLYLDDRRADAATGQGGAEESMRRFDRVDRELVRAHRTDSARVS